MPLDRSLRRTFWLVPAPFLALAAFWNAQAVSELIGVRMAVDATQLAQAPRSSSRQVPAAASARQASAQPILARNPFDSVTGPLVAKAAALEASGTPAPEIDATDPWNAPICEAIDVNAIAASSDIDWSFASLAGSDKKAHLLRRGGEVSGKKVHFIGWDRLWLSGDDGLCQAILLDAKKAPPPVAKAPAPATSTRALGRRGAKPMDPELRKGIQAVSATEFNIDRSVVDRILENQSELMRQAKIIPVQENGRTVGVRLLGVRSDALLGVLGMKNNDRLQTINGFEVANPEKALEAYARLRTADKLTIQINRDGKNMNLDYNIR